jgi:HAD superfamily hydrolase (TIGR01509 family)
VIFDVDGTLVDSNYLHVLAWSRTFAGAGEDVAMASIHRLIGKGSTELVEGLIGKAPAELLDAHGERFAELRADLRPFPAARDLLHAVSERGLIVALASSAKPDDHEANLEALDADGAIAFSTQSGDVDEAKPAPDIFQFALDEADLDRERTVVVGDTVWDVAAACQAGLATIGLTCGGISGAELVDAGAEEVYDGPGHLLDRLDDSIIGRL